MKNRRFWIMLEAIMLIIWITTLIIFLTQIFSKGTVCMANPLIYGVKELQNENNVTFTCKCQFENQPEKIIFVDSKHWESRDINYETNLLK